MLVYRFLNKEYGLKSIKEKRLKISRMMELNDPFEFLCIDLSDKKIRDGMLSYKKQMAENYGLICFSRNWSSPLLWGHYADKHKGLCLGFEVPLHKNILKKIDYVKKRLPEPKELTYEFANRLLYTKFHQWSYEREYRAYTKLDDEIDGKFYCDFSDDMFLKQVIIGCDSDVTDIDIKNLLGDMTDGVEIIQARPAFRDFKVVRRKDV